MSKAHFRRRGGFVHISPEAEQAYSFIGERPANLHAFVADFIVFLNTLDDADPMISVEALAGIALSADVARLLLAATPSACLEDLEVKRMIFENNEPFSSEPALLPLLCEASIISDEYRLGIRSRSKIVNE